MNLVYTKCYYLRFVIKCGNQGWCKQIHRNSDTLCKQRAANQAKLHTRLHAVIASRTDILADKGGQRQCKTGNRQKSKSLNLGVRTASCHCRSAKCIDVCLYDNVCK